MHCEIVAREVLLVCMLSLGDVLTFQCSSASALQ